MKALRIALLIIAAWFLLVAVARAIPVLEDDWQPVMSVVTPP
jgi:hypothetical protein